MFIPHEFISYRFDYLEMTQSLKFAGIINSDWSQFEFYHREIRPLIRHKLEPYTEIGLHENITSGNTQYHYVFGCLVNSLDNLPEGAVGADTGFTKFAVMTIRCKTVDELLGDHAISAAHQYFFDFMPSVYKDQVCPPNPGETRGFGTIGHRQGGSVSIMEVYHASIYGEPEMAFYVPLKA